MKYIQNDITRSIERTCLDDKGFAKPGLHTLAASIPGSKLNKMLNYINPDPLTGVKRYMKNPIFSERQGPQLYEIQLSLIVEIED